MVYCTKCGHMNDDKAVFCSECGTRLMILGSGAVKDRGAGNGSLPGPAARKTSSNAVIVATAVIVAVVIIAVAVLMPLYGKDAPADGLNSSRGLNDGSWAEYTMSIAGKDLFAYGTCRITYSNVTETRFVMTMNMTANGRTATESITMVHASNIWRTEGFSVPGWTFKVMGEEGIETVIGLKNTTHTKTITADYVEDDWFHSSGCLIRADVAYNGGSTMTMTLVNTNIESVWEGSSGRTM